MMVRPPVHVDHPGALGVAPPVASAGHLMVSNNGGNNYGYKAILRTTGRRQDLRPRR